MVVGISISSPKSLLLSIQIKNIHLLAVVPEVWYCSEKVPLVVGIEVFTYFVVYVVPAVVVTVNVPESAVELLDFLQLKLKKITKERSDAMVLFFI